MREKKSWRKLLRKYNIPFEEVGKDIYLYPQNHKYCQTHNIPSQPDTLEDVWRVINIYIEGCVHRWKKHCKFYDHRLNRRKTKGKLHNGEEFFTGKVYNEDRWNWD